MESKNQPADDEVQKKLEAIQGEVEPILKDSLKDLYGLYAKSRKEEDGAYFETFQYGVARLGATLTAQLEQSRSKFTEFRLVVDEAGCYCLQGAVDGKKLSRELSVGTFNELLKVVEGILLGADILRGDVSSELDKLIGKFRKAPEKDVLEELKQLTGEVGEKSKQSDSKQVGRDEIDLWYG